MKPRRLQDLIGHGMRRPNEVNEIKEVWLKSGNKLLDITTLDLLHESDVRIISEGKTYFLNAEDIECVQKD